MATRHNLTLQEKVQLIFDNNEGDGLSQRKLATKYNISLGSVSNILKRKKEYLNDYENNQNQNVKRKFRNEHGQQLDDQIYEWFVQQRAKRIPISGPILQEKAREIAESLSGKYGSFKASNGWLDKFRTRHNISYHVICGESSSVDVLTVEDWIQRIPKIIDGYDQQDIFNCDETCLFFKSMPDKSLTLNKEDCKGGKKSKERVTILFCLNSVGEKLKPLVIGKSLKPRCFKNLNLNKIPIDWRANKTAWMNVKIFSEWLFNLNELMKKKKRKIILFVDNAPCHPVDIVFSNIRLQYFPPNTTSKLQPLDQVIIRAFKAHYRKYLVKRIIACCATAQTPDDIKITYLDAIYWIDAAWEAVTDTTIRNTFYKAGFKAKYYDNTISSISDATTTSPTSNYSTTSSTSDSSATSPTSDDLTSSSGADEQRDELKNLDNLLQHVTIGGQRMNASDFIDIDEDIPAFNIWFDNCERLITADLIELDDDDEVPDEDDLASTESPPKILEVMEMMRKLHLLATTQQPQLHPIINQLESRLTDIYISFKSKRQTTLDDFFENT